VHTAATEQPSFLLEVIRTGSGSGTVTSTPVGIDCGTDCDQEYLSLTKVTLTAGAATGSTFTGWSGAECSGPGPCVVSIDRARSVTADLTAGTTPPASPPSPPAEWLTGRCAGQSVRRAGLCTDVVGRGCVSYPGSSLYVCSSSRGLSLVDRGCWPG